MLINEITESKSLLQLLDLIREFCRETTLGDNTEKCIRLKESVENAEENDYPHICLYAKPEMKL